jgi:hypothetical protein
MGWLLQFDFFYMCVYIYIYILVFLFLLLKKSTNEKNEFFPDQFKASHGMETQEALHTDPCETHTPFAALK